MTRHRLIASLLIGAVAFAGAASAQDVQLYRSGETPSARDVARILGGKSATPDAAAAQPDSEAQRTRWSRPNPWCKSTARRRLSCTVLSVPLRTAEWAQYR